MSANSVAACPECDRTGGDVYERKRADPAWVCYNCGAEFDEPNYRAPREGPHQEQSSGPTAAPLETPAAVFAGVEPGATLEIDEYQDPFTLMEVRQRTVWDVPFGEDWVDAEVIVTAGAGITGTAYRTVVTSAGEVDLYRPYPDQNVRKAEKHITSADAADHTGEVSRAAKLQLLDDDVEKPDGDDSWRRYYQEGEA